MSALLRNEDRRSTPHFPHSWQRHLPLLNWENRTEASSLTSYPKARGLPWLPSCSLHPPVIRAQEALPLWGSSHSPEPSQGHHFCCVSSSLHPLFFFSGWFHRHIDMLRCPCSRNKWQEQLSSSKHTEPSIPDSLLPASRQNFSTGSYSLSPLSSPVSPSVHTYSSSTLPSTDCSCWGHWQAVCCPFQGSFICPPVTQTPRNSPRGDHSLILQAFPLWDQWLHTCLVWICQFLFSLSCSSSLIQFLMLDASKLNVLHFLLGLYISCVLMTQKSSVRIRTANNQKSNSVLSNKDGLLAYITAVQNEKHWFRVAFSVLSDRKHSFLEDQKMRLYMAHLSTFLLLIQFLWVG